MTGIRVCIVTIILTIIYVALSVAITNLFFHSNSTGSLIKSEGKIIGSKLIGQDFKNDIFFHGRPSLNFYNGGLSGNSEFSHFSNELNNAVTVNYNRFKELNQSKEPDLNLITESASGLDPHITYKGALSQIDRIAHFANIDKKELSKIINKKAKPRIFGLYGEKIINVLELNLGLKEIYAKTSRSR